MESLQGQLLLASTELHDPNFFHTVVLILRHDDQGAFGLVLNRPTAISIGEVWKQVSESEYENDSPIYMGGPVEGPLMALHGDPSQAELIVMPEVCYSVQSDQLEQVVAQKTEQVKFFLGFSGWGPGQLEAELAEEAWVTQKATSQHVFSENPDLWEDLMRHAPSSLLAALNIKHIPDDPRWN